MRIPLPKQYHKTVDLSYKGKNIRTYVFGKGQKKILCLPAFPHSGLIYLYLTLNYDLDRIQLITFDIPGWIGNSESIYSENVYSEETLLDLINRIINYYNLQQFSLLGFSFGNSLAAKLLPLYSESISRVAFVSPILKGVDVDDVLVRTVIKTINKLEAYKIAKEYVYYRFKKYSKYLLSNGMDKTIVSEYFKLINHSNPKVLFTSIKHLYESDYSNEVLSFRDRDVMVVNSKDETPYFRKQAAHIRHILNGEKSVYLHGNHEDFILKPQSEHVKEVMRFLIN